MKLSIFTLQNITPTGDTVRLHRPITDYKNGDDLLNYIEVDSYKIREGMKFGIVNSPTPKKAFVQGTSEKMPPVVSSVVGEVQEVKYLSDNAALLKLWAGNSKVDVLLYPKEADKYPQGSVVHVFGGVIFNEYNGRLTPKFVFPAIDLVSESHSIDDAPKLAPTTPAKRKKITPPSAPEVDLDDIPF